MGGEGVRLWGALEVPTISVRRTRKTCTSIAKHRRVRNVDIRNGSKFDSRWSFDTKVEVTWNRRTRQLHFLKLTDAPSRPGVALLYISCRFKKHCENRSVRSLDRPKPHFYSEDATNAWNATNAWFHFSTDRGPVERKRKQAFTADRSQFLFAKCDSQCCAPPVLIHAGEGGGT